MIEKETLIAVMAILTERKNLAEYKFAQGQKEYGFIVQELEEQQKIFRRLLNSLHTI